MEEGGGGGEEDPVQALPLPQAAPGLAQVDGAFLISLHSGASRHSSAMSPEDNTPHPPYLGPSSSSQSFPLFL